MKNYLLLILFLGAPFFLISQPDPADEKKIRNGLKKIFAENDSIKIFIENKNKCEALVYRIKINNISKSEKEKLKKYYDELQESMNKYLSLFVEDIRNIKTIGALVEGVAVTKNRRKKYSEFYKEAAKDLERFQSNASDALDAEMGVFAKLIDIGLATFFPASIASIPVITAATEIISSEIEKEKYKDWDQL